MPHLFTPYLREGHQERITRRLFTAKSFIEFMGGEIIQVKSPNVDERGTSIAFSIPLKTGTLAELQLQDSKKDLMGKKILIVDDSQTNLKILKGLLERNGMTCVVIDGSTTGGKDSIDALIEANVKKKEHEHPFDLVLMDLQMPGMDGLQASREIRKIRKLAHLPIVALTGNDPQEYRAQSLEAGMNAFMEKPCQPKTLFPLMARLIDEAREKAHAWKSNKLRKSYSSKDATLIHAFDELPLATTINNLRIRDDHNMERIHPGAN
jgi:CheY-like chemotaxis protein